MSHAAKQIRDWVIGACTGVSSLPDATEGSPRQVASNTTACFVRTSNETIVSVDVHAPTSDERVLDVEVGLIAGTYTAVDALSVLAEEAIANEASFPGANLRMVRREYEENRDTDRDYVSLILSYEAVYYCARNDVETFQ